MTRTGFVMGCLALLLSSCSQKDEPKYSNEIGVNGVALAAGELAGTWIGQLEFATIVDTGIVGEKPAGANGGRVIKIAWDAAQQTYSIELRWCWDEVFEVEGQQSDFDAETLHRLRPVLLTAHVDDERGELKTDVIADMWGLQNLPDPFNTTLPNKDDFRSPPQSEWVLDEDGDGNPGVTVHISGIGNGDGYIINRSIWSLDGVARSKDELVGLVRTDRLQQNLLDSTVMIAGQRYAGETKQRPDPDPHASWFQMLRVQEGATCDDAVAARADGRLPTRKPF